MRVGDHSLMLVSERELGALLGWILTQSAELNLCVWADAREICILTFFFFPFTVVANEGQRIDIPDGCILENRKCEVFAV